MAKATRSGAGSGGSRGGAEVTALYESLQAYCCAARREKGSAIQDIDEVKTLVKSIDKSRLPRTVKASVGLDTAIRTIDKSYYHSCITTANQIFVDYPFLDSKTKEYGFYRGESQRVQAVYNAFKKFQKTSGIANPNKWNPADIWIVNTRFTIKDNFSSIEELNNYMLQQYNSGMLIGVSLKKLSPRGGAHADIFNDGKQIGATFSSFKAGDSITSSKDVYIEFSAGGKAGAIQLRVFSSRPQPGSWQGEIGGKTAAGGKVGGGKLIELAIAAGVPASYLLTPQSFSSHIQKPSPAKIKEMADLWIDVKGINTITQKQKNELIASITQTQKVDKTWWLSKFVSLQYCSAIKKANLLNQVTNQIYKYGSSSVDNSSVFVKYGPA